MRDAPKGGDVWEYSYLWKREADRGETEGRKDRPCAITILIKRRDGLHRLILLAITSKSPVKDRHAIEIPEIEKQRAGLDLSQRLWAVIDEYNSDIAERSYYFDPDAFIGRFSAAFVRRLQGELRAALTAGSAKGTRRDD